MRRRTASGGEGRGGRSRGRDQGSSRGSSRGSRFQYKRRSEQDVKERQEKGGDDREGIFSGDVSLFSPAKNDNCVRILPPTWDAASHYGFDIYVHYGVGSDNSAVLCPKAMKTGDYCPICEERQKALDDGDEEYARKLNYSHRVMYYILDRDNEKDGLKVWTAPFASIDKQVTAQTRDARTGEVLYIDDPDVGYDIEFIKEGEKERTKYTGVRVARNASDIGRDQDEYLDHITEHPLPELLNHATPEHIEELFYGKSSRSSSSDEGEEDFTYDEIMDMDSDELEQVVEDQDLQINIEDYDPTDEGDKQLAGDICEELGIIKPRRSSGRGKASKALGRRR